MHTQRAAYFSCTAVRCAQTSERANMLQRPANVLGRRAELIDRGPERPSTQRFKAGDAAAVAVQDQPAPGPACVVAVGGSLPPVHGDQAMLAVKEIQETSNRCPPGAAGGRRPAPALPAACLPAQLTPQSSPAPQSRCRYARWC